MAGHRSERVGARSHQEISVRLDREISDPRLAGVTVTRVEVTGDLRLAKVYVSAPDSPVEERQLKEALQRAGHYMRKQLAASMDLRYTPELRFYIDHSVQEGERFLQVLAQVQAESQAKKGRRRTQDK